MTMEGRGIPFYMLELLTTRCLWNPRESWSLLEEKGKDDDDDDGMTKHQLQH